MSRDTAASHGVVLEVRDLVVARDGERLLDGVSFDLHRGERLGVLGERASGRSLVADALLGLLEDARATGGIAYHPPDGGPIDVLDLRPAELRRFRWRRVALVPADAREALNPVMRVRETFEETLRVHGVGVRDGLARASRLLSDLGLDAERILAAHPRDLETGETERIVLALALLLEPDVLVVDGAATAMRVLARGELADRHGETAVLALTDDPRLLSGLADRIAVLYAFGIVEVGPARAVIDDAAHPYTRALLRAAFERVPPPAGEHPEPGLVPAGCPYHPRCPLADEQCEVAEPTLDAVGEDHRAACFYPDLAREELPFERDR